MQESAKNINFGMNYNNQNFVGPHRTYNLKTETPVDMQQKKLSAGESQI